jgi:hypothetical protein
MPVASDRNLPWPDPKPIVHDMTGNGYPAQWIAVNGDWDEVLIEHWNRAWVRPEGAPKASRAVDIVPIELRAGDQVIFGYDALSAKTYWVLWSIPHKEKPGAFMAKIEALPPKPVTILGQAYP